MTAQQGTTLFVCVTCRGAEAAAVEPRPGARLFEALERASADIKVAPVECLSNCQHGCSAAVAAPGKWTYVIGHLHPDQHADDMLAFARQHRDAADGVPAWRERPAHVRRNTIARVPPMPIAKELS